jgi:alkanesulfonate monooxygenase SsuD/methylene tetrahydromethanopterin reductase-like flavin-dependent oxidoreductase (luciferase family)
VGVKRTSQLRAPTSETDPEQAEFDREADYGSLYVGSPETVSRRIAATAKALGISRFDMKYSAGGLSHERILRCIRLYGEKVIPLALEMLAADGNRGR